MFTGEIDRQLVLAINGFAGKSYGFDQFVLFAADAPLIKLGLPLALAVVIWFRYPESRSRFIAALLGVLAALLLARIAQISLPPRLRPMHGSLEGLRHIAERSSLQGWSAFPSDHAALMFSLTTLIMLISRPLGLITLFWSVFVVCLPRIFLGFHYPSDIAAGGALGVISVLAAVRLLSRHLVPVAKYADRAPHYFYAIGFIVLFSIGTMFKDARDLALLISRLS